MNRVLFIFKDRFNDVYGSALYHKDKFNPLWDKYSRCRSDFFKNYYLNGIAYSQSQLAQYMSYYEEKGDELDLIYITYGNSFGFDNALEMLCDDIDEWGKMAFEDRKVDLNLESVIAAKNRLAELNVKEILGSLSRDEAREQVVLRELFMI